MVARKHHREVVQKRKEDPLWTRFAGASVQAPAALTWGAPSTSAAQAVAEPTWGLPSTPAGQVPAAPTWAPPPTPPAPPRQMSPSETAAQLFGASSTTAGTTAQRPAPTGSSRASSPTVVVGADQAALLKEILTTQQRIMNDVQGVKARQVLMEERIHGLQDGLREMKSRFSAPGWG